MVFLALIFFIEGCDQVLNLFLVPDWISPPVLKYESKVRLEVLDVLDLVILAEGFSHDCN